MTSQSSNGPARIVDLGVDGANDAQPLRANSRHWRRSRLRTLNSRAVRPPSVQRAAPREARGGNTHRLGKRVPAT